VVGSTLGWWKGFGVIGEAQQAAMSKPRVIAVANQKGGTGKSTVTVNVAAAVGETARRALVVDLDPQADATTMLGIDPDSSQRTLYDVFVGGCELPGAIATEVAPGVDLAIGTERMGDVELTLAGEMMRERYLDDTLDDHLDRYDLVLLDCPPNLGLLTVNAFCAASAVLIVVSMTDRNAYKGAMALAATVAKLQRKGAEASIAGILRNNVDRQRSTYRLLNDALAGAGLPLLKTEIPLRASFQNAVTAGIPIIKFRPDSIGAEAMRAVAAELVGAHAPARAA
jgi:chromosome partitioning protein